jgi:hypothetical protein
MLKPPQSRVQRAPWLTTRCRLTRAPAPSCHNRAARMKNARSKNGKISYCATETVKCKPLIGSGQFHDWDRPSNRVRSWLSPPHPLSRLAGDALAVTRREQYVLPWYRVRLSRGRARRLVRCYELGQASVLVFQIFMGVAPYKRVKKPSCATWSCRHHGYTNRTQAPRNALASLEPCKPSLFPRPTLRLYCCN